MALGDLNYKHLLFFSCPKAEMRKAFFIMFFTFWSAFLHPWPCSHTAPVRTSSVSYIGHLHWRKQWHGEVPQCFPNPELPSAYLELLKTGATFLQTNQRWLTPTAKCLVLPSARLQLRNNLGLFVQGWWHLSVISHFDSKDKDVRARALRSRRQMPHSGYREWSRCSCGVASPPWEGASLGTQSTHSPYTVPGTPWNILTPGIVSCCL